MKYEGYNGQVEVDAGASTLTITRDGMVARANFGKGEPRVVPFQAVSGSALVEPTRLKNGWITLGTGGADAPALSASTAPSHIDTIVFTYKNREAFQQLHDWLASLAAHNIAQGIDYSDHEVVGGRVARSDELAAAQRSLSGRVEANRARADAHRAEIGERRAERAAEREILRSEAADARRELADGMKSVGRMLADGASAASKSALEPRFEGFRISEDALHAGWGRSWDIAEVSAEVSHGATRQGRVTATRLVAGGALAGPAGLIVGGLAKKDRSKIYLEIAVPTEVFLVELSVKQEGAARTFAQQINTAAARARYRRPGVEPTEATSGVNMPVVDVADQIAKLAALRDQGILTSEEFATQKAKLLGA